MKRNKFSPAQTAKCLQLIKAQGPVLAIALAEQLGIEGERETKRREIRAIVQHLRNDCGEMITGDFSKGYVLTQDEKEWQQYLDSRQKRAKTILAVTHKALKMVTDAKGQGLLFVPGNRQLNNTQFQRSA